MRGRMKRYRTNKARCFGIIAFLVFLLTGCFNPITQGIDTEKVDKTEWTVIRIPVYDRGWQDMDPTNNYWTKWIQQKFGDPNEVRVSFVPINRNLDGVNFKQLLAAGTAPDLIFDYDYPKMMDYYLEEGLQSLDADEIKTYAPTFWEKSRKREEAYGSIDGELKFILAERRELVATNFVELIRQDWIDAVNMSMPHSLEEYHELLQAWQEAGLGFAAEVLQYKSFNFDYAYREWPIDFTERALHSDLAVAGLPWEPTKEFIKTKNYEWHQGWISEEFYLDKNGQKAKNDFITGRAGVWSSYIYNTTIDAIEILMKNQPDAKLAVLDPMAHVPKGNKPQGRQYWPFGIIYGINSHTSESTRIAIWKYLEWMSQPDILFTLQNGFEGTHYVMDEEGLPQSLDYSGKERLTSNANADYWCFITANKEYENDEISKKAAVKLYAPPGYEYLIEDIMAYNERYSEYFTQDVIYSVPIRKVSEYSGDLAELFTEMYVRLVMIEPESFEVEYDKAIELYKRAGYDAIIEEKQEALRRGLYD